MSNTRNMDLEIARAAGQMVEGMARSDLSVFAPIIQEIVMPSKNDKVEAFLKSRVANMERSNAVSKHFRENSRALLGKSMPSWQEITKGQLPEMAKAAMDVGTLTNFANITGGQSLGYVSLDTQMARGTIRPSSFTLYQALNKTHAYQVVDYWSIATDTGGPLPGAAFNAYGNVATGTLSTTAGIYDLQNITLKLAVNGRALTVALAAQNSFVDIAAQENTNAALDILSSVDWACYWGDSAVFSGQFDGIYKSLPAANIVDWGTWNNTYATGQGWSNAQSLFNLIYEWAGQITSYGQFGRITHAFMTPVVAGSLQGLVTTLLNNLVNLGSEARGITVNGDLQGMMTRFGNIQFPIDILINVRDRPAQAILNSDGTNKATTVAPTKPASVSVAVSGGADTKSQWTAAYVASSGWYEYAVASCDSNMNESVLTFATTTSGVTTTIPNVVSIAGPVVADAQVFRVYRSGLLGSNISVSGNPASFRYIGTVAASGSGTVTFVDENAKIPGAETIFLLDLDEQDSALDYRYLLPLTKVELFAQSLYMPWAVAQIGAVRIKVPKFHGSVKNYVPDSPTFNPLLPNQNAV